jgi:glycosyltransferase involved in cell wall biosynthesis
VDRVETAGPGAHEPPFDACLVAHFAYGAMTGGQAGHVGGVERQTSLMARWLAARGHRVALVTWAEGPPGDETIDGVRIVKVCARAAGLPGLRFVHPRWTSLAAALARADARTYYHNSAEYVTGQVAWWARRHARRFVYSVASDMDCDPSLPDLHSRRERWLYTFGLRRARPVIAQTTQQVSMLRDGFGVEATVVPMPCPAPGEGAFQRPAWRSNGRVLWVGRICEVKRPDRLLEVAEACPEMPFDLVGPAGDDTFTRAVLQRARQVPNVVVHGRASRDQMEGFYRQATMLLCTSDREGFPNTFLEAWSHGVPVVSTLDPDGLIGRLGLGAVVGTPPAGIAAALSRLQGSSEAWTDASRAARAHYLAHHTVDRVMERFEALLIPAVESGSR